jgi:hypothetical protein
MVRLESNHIFASQFSYIPHRLTGLSSPTGGEMMKLLYLFSKSMSRIRDFLCSIIERNSRAASNCGARLEREKTLVFKFRF